MKTKITLLFLLFAMNFASKAQTYVTIPDTNFVYFLINNYPTCMSGFQMDTTCPDIQGEITLDVGNMNISNLTGLEYFSNLHYLYCYNNQLTSLPQITSNSLLDFYCDNNMLTNLPAIPSSVTELTCSNNQLTSLPSLPNLDRLECQHNQLTSLPSLPSYLVWLHCEHNQLTSLPALPNMLYSLTCNNNQLASLPALPSSLLGITCDSNLISCFPEFPSTFIYSLYFDISHNPFSCLPNYVPAMDAGTLAYPLCVNGDTINNSNGCASAKGIVGFTYKDNTSNCINDIGDQGLINIPIKLYNTSGIQLAETYSLANGIYNFCDTIGTYTTLLDTVGAPFYSQCIYPGIDSTVTLSISTPLVSDVNYDIACKAGFDLGIQSVIPTGWVFPGQQHEVNIIAGDLSHWYNLNCANGVSGQVKVIVTGPVTYAGIQPGAHTPIVAGNVLTYTVADFGAINNSHDFGLLFTTDNTAQTGDQVCINVIVTPVIGDNDTSNNSYQFCYQAINSYDPNMKEVYPVDVPPAFHDYFTYTIHFQNTGTAPAMNIHLVDMLSNNLDPETFQVTNYSHNNITSLIGNVLTIRFPNIQLPDSTSNSEGSKGFVQYRIKPKANLPLGTQITNTANIYFDYNNPINTNTTVNTYTATANVQNLNSTINSVLISPNPFTSQTTIMFDKEQKNTTIKIMDVLGKEIKTINFTGKQLVLEKGDMQKGIYFVQVIDKSFDKLRMTNVVNKKIVIQ